MCSWMVWLCLRCCYFVVAACVAVSGGVSDGGYNSMTLDDVQKLSQFSSIEHNCLTSLSSSPPTSDHEPLDLKSKFLSQDAMSFTVTSRDLSFCDLKGRHIEKPNIGQLMVEV